MSFVFGAFVSIIKSLWLYWRDMYKYLYDDKVFLSKLIKLVVLEI